MTEIEEDEDGALLHRCPKCGLLELAEAPKTTELALSAHASIPPNGTTAVATVRPPAWKVFDPAKVGLKLSVSASGQVRLPLLALEMLGDPERVELLHEDERHWFGIRGATGRHTVKVSKNANGITIGAKRCLEYYHCLPAKTIKCQARMAGDVLAFQVKES